MVLMGEGTRKSRFITEAVQRSVREGFVWKDEVGHHPDGTKLFITSEIDPERLKKRIHEILGGTDGSL